MDDFCKHKWEKRSDGNKIYKKCTLCMLETPRKVCKHDPKNIHDFSMNGTIEYSGLMCLRCGKEV